MDSNATDCTLAFKMTEDNHFAIITDTIITGGGGSSIVKVPGDVPPARVRFFKPSSLAKGMLFANFSSFSLFKGILFANFCPFSLGKGILFDNFGQRTVKLR